MIRPWKVFCVVAVGAAVLPCSAMAQAPVITAPGGAGSYTVDQVVNAAYSCAPSAAACEGTVPNGAPIDTKTPGTRNFTVTAKNAEGSTLATSTVSYQVVATGGGTSGGDVPATLNLDLGTSTAFAAFVPGVTRDYTATLVATITSTAENNLLTVADTADTNVGRMVNGAYALSQPVQVGAVKTAPETPTFAPLGSGSAPTPLLTFAAPVSGAAAHVTFKQAVAATDVLRTGTYSKTLTFTLSTTNP